MNRGVLAVLAFCALVSHIYMRVYQIGLVGRRILLALMRRAGGARLKSPLLVIPLYHCSEFVGAETRMGVLCITCLSEVVLLGLGLARLGGWERASGGPASYTSAVSPERPGPSPARIAPCPLLAPVTFNNVFYQAWLSCGMRV